jgi:hypothetical protein
MSLKAILQASALEDRELSEKKHQYPNKPTETARARKTVHRRLEKARSKASKSKITELEINTLTNGSDKKYSLTEKEQIRDLDHRIDTILVPTTIKTKKYGTGKKSTSLQVDTEFWTSHLKMPANVESWRDNPKTQLDGRTGEIVVKPQILPKISPLAGINKPSLKAKAERLRKLVISQNNGSQTTVKCVTPVADPTDPKNMTEFQKHHVDHASN